MVTGLPTTTDPVIEYRLTVVERTVMLDHEPRLRRLEGVAAKVAVFAAAGSFTGGAVIAALINYFIK